MAQRILHPEWRKSLEPTPYPFVDEATLSNNQGVFIPEGTFLDAILYPIGGGLNMRLSQVKVGQQTITLTIGDDVNKSLCSGSIDLLNVVDEIPLFDVYGRPAGLLVSTRSRLILFQTWAPGTYTFTSAQTGFAAAVCLPTPEIAFRGFLLEDGSIITGNIWIVGDDGIVVGVDQNVIRVDVVGDPLFKRRLCSGNFSTPRFLKSITFQRGCRKIVCRPDASGNISMSVGHRLSDTTVLRIRSTDSGLQIEAVGEAQ